MKCPYQKIITSEAYYLPHAPGGAPAITEHGNAKTDNWKIIWF